MVVFPLGISTLLRHRLKNITAREKHIAAGRTHSATDATHDISVHKAVPI